MNVVHTLQFTISRNRSVARHGRRAIAMLLVLICMAAATISATAYLSSRDNSAAIGENVANGAAARWAASSGLDLAIATLQMNSDWCSLHTNGTLYQDVPMGNALVTVKLSNFVTGQPLQSCAKYVTVTAIAHVGGVEQSTGALVFFTDSSADSVAVDLSEFAAFVSGQLDVRGNAIIARWPSAPLAKLGRRVAIGLNSESSDAVRIRDGAAALDVTSYRHPNASLGYLDLRSGPEIHEVVLPDRVPFPAAPSIAAVPPTVLPTPIALIVSDTQLVTENYRARRIDASGTNTVLRLQGEITVVVQEDFEISSNAKVVVDGNVRLIVFGNLILDRGAIELTNNSQLTVFVRGGDGTNAMEIHDSYIGNVQSDSTVDTSGYASWMDPRRATFYSVAGTSQQWSITGNSAVKASLYAPDASRVVIQNTSALYGRVASTSVRLADSAAIYYCPGLNTQDGYTNIDSGLYDSDGRLRSEFRLLSSLDPLILEPIADTTRKVIKLGNQLLGGDTSDAGDDDNSSTEQTLHFDPHVFGTDVSMWEGL